MKKKPKVGTYTSMTNYIYQDSQNIEQRSNEFSAVENIAYNIFGVLQDRKGFDWWFGDLDSDIKNSIFNEVKKQIKLP